MELLHSLHSPVEMTLERIHMKSTFLSNIEVVWPDSRIILGISEKLNDDMVHSIELPMRKWLFLMYVIS